MFSIFSDSLLSRLINARGEKEISFSSPYFFFFFFYACLVWIFGSLDFLCFFFRLPQCSIISRILGILFISFLIIKFKTYFFIENQKKSTIVIIGVLFIILFSLTRIPYADCSYDVLAYHLIAQRPGFVNYFVNNNFALGHYQVWGFPLADKMFWYFRFFLGYRCGTVLNSIALVVSYFQVIYLFDLVFTEKDGSKNKTIILNTSMWALLIVLSHQLILMVGTYMVDIISLPFILEAQICLIKAIYKKQDKIKIMWFCLLLGFCFAFKLTNVIYIIPQCICYYLLIRNQLSLRTFIFGSLFFLLPVLPYLLFNWYSVGNPIFPYFNTIFKSNYFPLVSAKDIRWGPEGLLQIILWPFFLVFKPQYRQSEIPQLFNLLLQLGALGLLIRIVRFLVFIKQKKIHPIDLMMFVFVFSGLLWSLSTGYSRYFEFGYIFYGFFALYLFYEINKRVFLTKTFSTLLSFLFLSFLIIQNFQTIISIEHGRCWNNNKFSLTSAKKEIKKIFKDRNEVPQKDIDIFFLTSKHYCGVADFLNPDSLIINAYYKDYTPYVQNLYNNLINNIKNNDNKNIYDIQNANFSMNQEYINLVNKYNFDVIDIEKKKVLFGDYYLVKLRFCSRPSGNYFPVLTDNQIRFGGSNASSFKYIVKGFSWEEPTHTWTEGPEAELRFVLEPPEKNLELIMEYGTFDGRQPVRIYANDQMIADYVAEGEEKRSLVIPKDTVGADGCLALRFELPGARSPASQGLSSDTRNLALSLKSIMISSTEREFDFNEQIEVRGYYKFGIPLSFSGNYGATGNKYIVKGFSREEPTHTWTEGPEAELRFVLEPPEKNLELIMEYGTFDGRQPVRIYANDQMIADYVAEGEEKRSLVIPKDTVGADGCLALRFELPGARSPASQGLSSDTRNLALSFSSIVIFESNI